MSWQPNYGLDPNQNFASSLNFSGTPNQSSFSTQRPFGVSNSPGSVGAGINWGQGLSMGLQGLSAIGNAWGAWQSHKLAKDQLNFTKMITNTNLNNQIKSYNTALEDRSRSRAAVEGQTSAEAQAYVDKNKLSRG